MKKRAADILPISEMLPDDLYRRLVYFVDTWCIRHDRLHRYGWGHLLFACYAALPAHLTPDLLHKLRLNFRHYQFSPQQDPNPLLLEQAEKAGIREISPFAVNDLLLSNLLREAGYERYEMPEELRRYLLWLLQHSKVLEEQCGVTPLPDTEAPHGLSKPRARLYGISEFLKRYADEYYTASDAFTKSLREAQKWAAQSWQDPQAAARYLHERLSAASKATELYHYSKLGQQLGLQYDLKLNVQETGAGKSFDTLRVYAEGVAALYEGKLKAAEDILAGNEHLIATDGAQPPGEGAVRLPVPKEVAEQLLQRKPELLQQQQMLGLKPRRWDSLEARLRSPWPKAVLCIDDGPILETAEILQGLEKILREAYNDPDLLLSEFFDIVAGSHFSAVLATLVAQGKSGSSIVALAGEIPPAQNQTGWIRETFKDIRFNDSSFKSAVLIGVKSMFDNKAFLSHTLPQGSKQEAPLLSDMLLGATNTSNQGAIRSVNDDPAFVLSLATIDLLLKEQPNWNWRIDREHFLLTPLRAEAPPEKEGPESPAARERLLRAQAQRMEATYLRLVDKQRMWVETIGPWPEAWKVGYAIKADYWGKTDALSLFLQTTEALFRENEMEKGFEAIEQMDKQFDLGLGQDVILQKSNYRMAIDQRNLGLIDIEPFKVAEARVKYAILELLKDIPRKAAYTNRLRYSLEVPDQQRLESILGEKSNLIKISWLEKGLQAGKSVCTVSIEEGKELATGFIIEGGYLITACHVLPNREMVGDARITFYESDGAGVTYLLDPSDYIKSDITDLDFVRVKVGDRTDTLLSSWGELRFATELPIAGDNLTVINFPQGKSAYISGGCQTVEIVEDKYLRYKADTEPGSSGAPVFNENWEVVGMHHAFRQENNLKEAILASGILLRISELRSSGAEEAPRTQAPETGYRIGDTAGDFRLKNVTGEPVALADYYSEAKGVIIVFTCNHCPYAQMYEQRIIALHQRFAPLGYPVMAINPNNPLVVPEDSFEKMQERARAKQYPFAYLFDEQQQVYPMFGATRTPHVFLLDDKKIVRYIGAIDNNAENPNAATQRFVEDAVTALMGGTRPNPDFTRAVGCTIKNAPVKNKT